LRTCEPAHTGDVLTLMLGGRARVVEIIALPSRRGSPSEARSHYREIDLGAPAITNLDTGHLDPIEQKALAAPSPGRG
jgi:ribosome-associated heat shock protein Hsp15